MKNFAFNNKKVLVRVDFNVPVDKQFQITDDTRIQAVLPTLNHILDQGGALILLSHFGRPDEKFKPDGSVDVERFTQRHLLSHLSKVLNRPVQFCDELTGEKPAKMAAALKPGEVLLMENTRFHPGEKKGNEDLAREWAALADIYINDAFGAAHRAHASTTTVAKFFGAEAKGFGYLMDEEVKNGKKVLEHPDRPLTAIIGGAKVSDKILLLDRLIGLADNIIVGGGMAYTFMKAQGGAIGKSLVEDDRLDLAKELLKKAKDKGVNFLLPEDSVIADQFANEAQRQTTDSKSIPDGWMGLDIGPKACEAFTKAILSSKTILWNGPMGVFEMPNFANGTKTIAEAVAKATSNGAFSLVGGGDSVAALNQLGLEDQISFVSTGGGAMLELLEGKELPGVAAINK
ncbi:MAG: phosphoglycerate kinase [Saprospirales bacterium]|nr:phosphoglycerate kinase [Saprospirales bacterium]